MTINPDHLIEQALRLSQPNSAGRPRQVDLRRSVSAAYYAVFHYILGATADEIVGPTQRQSPQYQLIYRGIEHRTVHDICEEITKPKPSAKFARYFPAAGFGTPIVQFSAAFLDLQERRHTADYDPLASFKVSDAKFSITMAQTAILQMAGALLSERRLFLSLLVFKVR